MRIFLSFPTAPPQSTFSFGIDIHLVSISTCRMFEVPDWSEGGYPSLPDAVIGTKRKKAKKERGKDTKEKPAPDGADDRSAHVPIATKEARKRKGGDPVVVPPVPKKARPADEPRPDAAAGPRRAAKDKLTLEPQPLKPSRPEASGGNPFARPRVRPGSASSMRAAPRLTSCRPLHPQGHPTSVANPFQSRRPVAPAAVGPRPSTSSGGGGLLDKMRSKLQGGRFRQLNEIMYTQAGQGGTWLLRLLLPPPPVSWPGQPHPFLPLQEGARSFDLLQQQPELFDQYHEGFREQTRGW